MDLFGFSINNISLFGIALAIGIVVDNAIVIVENVERNMKLGMDVKKATKDTMDHVQNALIAITLVLSAVFVPTAFVEGISGQFYKQFALTIAVFTILSGVVSLTLSPALCVMLIKNNGEKPDLLTRIMNFLFGKFFKIFNRSFDWVSKKYGKAVHGIVRHWVLVIFTYVILLGLTGYLFSITPSGFIPKQNNDFLQISVQMPDGYSLGQTDKVMKRMQELLKEIDGIEKFMCVVGLNGATRTKSPDTGALFVKMDPKLERMPGFRALGFRCIPLSLRACVCAFGRERDRGCRIPRRTAFFQVRSSYCLYCYLRFSLKKISILSNGMAGVSYKSTWLAPGIISSCLLSPLSFLKASLLK